jgi:hypothetical protein
MELNTDTHLNFSESNPGRPTGASAAPVSVSVRPLWHGFDSQSCAIGSLTSESGRALGGIAR